MQVRAGTGEDGGKLRACVKAGLPDRPDHPDHQKCGGKKRSSWERVTARSQGSRRLDRL